MKFLKILLWIIGILAVIYLILCLAGPKKFEASATTTINAPAEIVFEEVADFAKHPAWSPWHQMDPNIKNTVTGTPGTVGHKDEWISEKMGNGSQEIVEIVPNQSMKAALRFVDFDNEPSWVNFNLKPNGEATDITWAMDGGDYPFFMRGMSFMMNMQKVFDEGLANLKKIAEAKPVTPKSTVAIEWIDLPAQWYVGKRFPKINEKQVDSALFGKTYGELGAAIGGMDKMTGMPFSIGHAYDYNTGDMDLEIAVPVAAEMKVPAGLTCVQIPAGKAAKHVYHGPYEESGKAWQPFMDELMKTHKPRWSGYEVYANDPTTVKSPSEIETWLIQPVE